MNYETALAHTNKGDLAALRASSVSALKYTANRKGQTALHLAALHDHVPCLAFLVTHAGLDINIPDGERNTPLLLAAAAGRLNALHFLSEHGGNVNKRNKAMLSPITAAAQNGHFAAVQYLSLHKDTRGSRATRMMEVWAATESGSKLLAHSQGPSPAFHLRPQENDSSSSGSGNVARVKVNTEIVRQGIISVRFVWPARRTMPMYAYMLESMRDARELRKMVISNTTHTQRRRGE